MHIQNEVTRHWPGKHSHDRSMQTWKVQAGTPCKARQARLRTKPQCQRKASHQPATHVMRRRESHRSPTKQTHRTCTDRAACTSGLKHERRRRRTLALVRAVQPSVRSMLQRGLNERRSAQAWHKARTKATSTGLQLLVPYSLDLIETFESSGEDLVAGSIPAENSLTEHTAALKQF